jgi:hypothetical protein
MYFTVGLGAVLAAIISWSRNSSVFWAIVHAWFGWLYVIYYLLRGKKLTAVKK